MGFAEIFINVVYIIIGIAIVAGLMKTTKALMYQAQALALSSNSDRGERLADRIATEMANDE